MKIPKYIRKQSVYDRNRYARVITSHETGLGRAHPALRVIIEVQWSGDSDDNDFIRTFLYWPLPYLEAISEEEYLASVVMES